MIFHSCVKLPEGTQNVTWSLPVVPLWSKRFRLGKIPKKSKMCHGCHGQLAGFNPYSCGRSSIQQIGTYDQVYFYYNAVMISFQFLDIWPYPYIHPYTMFFDHLSVVSPELSPCYLYMLVWSPYWTHYMSIILQYVYNCL